MDRKLKIKLLMFEAFFFVLFFSNLNAMKETGFDAEIVTQLKKDRIQKLDEELNRKKEELNRREKKVRNLLEEKLKQAENYDEMMERAEDLRVSSNKFRHQASQKSFILESRKLIPLMCFGFASLGLLVYYLFKKSKRKETNVPNNANL